MLLHSLSLASRTACCVSLLNVITFFGVAVSQSLKRQLSYDLKEEEWREIEAALGVAPGSSPPLAPVPLPLPSMDDLASESLDSIAVAEPTTPNKGGIAVYHRRAGQAPKRPPPPPLPQENATIIGTASSAQAAVAGSGSSTASWLDRVDIPWKDGKPTGNST